MSENLVSTMLKNQDRVGNKTVTTNNMPAFKSTKNACLDLFFHGAAYRQRSEQDIITLFSRAYEEDKELALRILAYFRDVREGSGERRFFRTCLIWLAKREGDNIDKVINLYYIPTIGRWDDLLCLIDTTKYATEAILAKIDNTLSQKEPDGLCAKWMPRKGRIARLIREYMDMYPKEYRKLLVKATNVVETKMCNKKWSDINYSHVPSMANIKYNKAFLRNDEERRRSFLESAKKGELKINSKVSHPHEIVRVMLRNSTAKVPEGATLERILINDDTAIAMWNQLPRIPMPNKRILACSDTSGSMGIPHSKTNDPICISLAMGIYLSEMLTGPFQNAFITFSSKPTLQYTEGNIYERLSQVKAIHPANTNLQAVFKLVLDTAVNNNLPEDQMPTDILIISDMQFDRAVTNSDDSAFAMIRKMYADSGYDMPNIIFWNVNAASSNFPIERNSRGVALVSGSSQNAIKSIMSGVTTPQDAMINTVNVDRYTKFLASH